MRPGDSLSKCDAHIYANPYQVGNHPELKPAATARPSIPRDSLESTKDKLQKEALSRLRHTSKYVVMQQGIMRIGKFLFLTAALPLYLLVYRIPKWVLVEAMPALMTLFGQGLNKVWIPIQKRIEAFIHKIGHFMQRSQEFISGLIQPVINIFLEIRNAIYQMNRRALQFMNRLFSRNKKGETKSAFSLRAIFNRAQEGIQRAAQWVAQQAAACLNPLRAGFIWLKQSSQALLPKEQTLNSVKAGWKAILKPFTSSYQNSRAIAKQATDWMTGQLSWCGQKAGQALRYATQWIPPLWKKASSLIKQGREFLGRHRKRAWHYIEAAQAKLKSITAKQVLTIISSKLKWLPEPLRRFFNAIIHHWLTEGIVHGVLKGISFIFTCLAQGISLIGQGIKTISSVLAGIIQSIVRFTSPFSQACGKGLLFIGKCVTGALYHLIVWIVMMTILFSWGMESVVQTSAYLFSLIRSKRASTNL